MSGDCVSIFSSFVDFGVGGVEWGGWERGVRQRETLTESDSRLCSGLHSDGWSSRRLSYV